MESSNQPNQSRRSEPSDEARQALFTAADLLRKLIASRADLVCTDTPVYVELGDIWTGQYGSVLQKIRPHVMKGEPRYFLAVANSVTNAILALLSYKGI
jgi:hypothetical protein